MPWTKDDVDKFKKGLSDKEKEKWVQIANSVYESCMKEGGTDDDCAAEAIKQANGSTEKKNNEREVRNLEMESAEISADNDSRRIEGYGIVFNSLSRDLGGFREIISDTALDGVLEKSDILALLNHDQSKGVLARSKRMKGTLNLKIDKKGMKYAFDAPSFDLGNQVLENIRRGEITTSSFAFSVDEKGQQWEKKADGTYVRTIFKFEQIYDVSPVYREAYSDTTVAIRAFDAFKQEEIPEGNPEPAETGTEEILKRILSDEEKYMRQLNYKFKINNK